MGRIQRKRRESLFKHWFHCLPTVLVEIAEMLQTRCLIVLTSSFVCPFGSKTDPRYLNDDILGALAVDGRMLDTWDREGREDYHFVHGNFGAHFRSIQSDSVEYCLHNGRGITRHNSVVLTLQICDVCRLARLDAWISHHCLTHSPIHSIIEQNRGEWTTLPHSRTNNKLWMFFTVHPHFCGSGRTVSP